MIAKIFIAGGAYEWFATTWLRGIIPTITVITRTRLGAIAVLTFIGAAILHFLEERSR